MEDNHTMRACVVVLGEWGHSPRMQYHALSLAKNGYSVDVVAYEGAQPHDALRRNKHISHHYLGKVPPFEKFCHRYLYYVLKTMWQSFSLLITLLCLSRPDVLLLQNPPSIPTLPICWFVCWLRKVNFIIDFHNYGYTLLALTLGDENRFVTICKWCEGYFGQKAAHTLCVSKAMKEDLAKNWDISSTVFYDCPPEIFHPISIEEKHNFFHLLGEDFEVFRASNNTSQLGDRTRFTAKEAEGVVALENRPVLIVSSTSWTEDEDFHVLLSALKGYNQVIIEMVAESNIHLPDLVVAITGKGPMKNMYEELIKKMKLTHVEIITLWLPAEKYPTMLACADIGISLHRSTSGLDLPMKVVDMFGCCLPVCAYYYPCIQELVKENENGLWFVNGLHLSFHLKNLLTNFPRGADQLLSYRQHLSTHPLSRWDESWKENALPIIRLLS